MDKSRRFHGESPETENSFRKFIKSMGKLNMETFTAEVRDYHNGAAQLTDDDTEIISCPSDDEL